jgi:integrase
MSSQPKTTRPRGTGSLYPCRGSWYGTWWVGSKQRKRKVGPMRKAATNEGLTKVQAEARLRKMMEETKRAPVVPERLTLVEVTERYIKHLENVVERRSSTVETYKSIVKKHIRPFFEELAMTAVTDCDIEDFIATRKESGLAPKTINNQVILLTGIFNFAVKRGWTDFNVVQSVDRPSQSDGDPDIRFLDKDEVEALLRATPEDVLGQMEKVLYLTGATTGQRQGELIGLRWTDVDRANAKIRVRRNIVRGILGKPKSRRSVREIPMTARLSNELILLRQRSVYKTDDDYVFCHPDTGSPYDPSKMRKRYKAAAKRAGIRQDVRFHDLRHTFGTRMASTGVPMRTLQAWMGHQSIQTTEIYAAYAPSPHEQEWVETAFGEAPPDVAPVVVAVEASPLDESNLPAEEVFDEPDEAPDRELPVAVAA